MRLPVVSIALALLLAPSAWAAGGRFTVSKVERTISLKPASFSHTTLKLTASSQSGGDFSFSVSPQSVGGAIAQVECALGPNALPVTQTALANGIALSFPVRAAQRAARARGGCES